MKTNFKVGDRVKIREWDGRTATIIDISGNDIQLKFDDKSGGTAWNYSTDMIQPLNETIVIYRKNRDVIALDKTTGRKAVAKCDPTDVFDFNTGAKLAFDRLLGGTEKDGDDVIRVGDTVTVRDTGKMYTTNSGWVAKHVKDANLIAKYAYGKSYYNDGILQLDDEFTVVAMDKDTAYIQKLDRECYLVNVNGLKKV